MDTAHHDHVYRQIDLTMPHVPLEKAIMAWASDQLGRTVFTPQQLSQIAAGLAPGDDPIRTRRLRSNIDIALGALAARQCEPEGGWEAYCSGWEEVRLQNRLGMCSEFDRLRHLRDRFGGLLLNGKACPLVLLIPLSNGQWVQMGWVQLALLEDNPLAIESPRVLAQRQAQEHVIVREPSPAAARA